MPAPAAVSSTATAPCWAKSNGISIYKKLNIICSAGGACSPALLLAKRGREQGNVTFFSEESNKEPVCDVKAAGFKLESSTGPRRAGESLNRPDESKLSSGRSLLFPFGLASPALRRFHRHATGNGWTRKSCITVGDSWQGRLPKSLLIEEKVLNVVKRMRWNATEVIVLLAFPPTGPAGASAMRPHNSA